MYLLPNKIYERKEILRFTSHSRCIYAGAVKTPFVEYLNFNTTFKITYDIAAIILVILAVLFFLKDKKENHTA